MSEFLLIHGSCHGAWCWHRLIPALQAIGHQVRAIDLPSHGRDHTDPAKVTLDLYAETITRALAGPTIVVGHSMAGYPITAAAERDPSNIAALVYVCAYVPVHGMSLADMRRAGPSQPLEGAILVDESRTCFDFDPGRRDDLLYHDCDVQARSLAALCLTPQPIKPQETPLALSARSQTLPRHYIRCTEDRTIPPAYQMTMSQGFASGHVSSLPASHSPFFAMPAALAAQLDAIARSLEPAPK